MSLRELDDAELMRRVQQGETALFGVLVERYRSPLLRVAYSKLGHWAWAEDVVQETCIAAFYARAGYKPRFAFRTWLWTILLNLCRRQWKQHAYRQSRTPPPDTPPPPLDGLPASGSDLAGLPRLMQLERAEVLHHCLARLPEVEADALRLRFFAELPFQELALALQCSVSGAKSRVKKGLERLSQLLLEEEAAS